ncbi:oligosaccharide flippase family protein [Sphingomonas sp. RS2018]
MRFGRRFDGSDRLPLLQNGYHMTAVAAFPTSIAQKARALWQGQLASQALWLTVPFGGQQVMRLATSIVLARLLAPEMFGIMVLINTLRTGTELLSDVGIGQSIVRSANAGDRRFLDTAFTIQFIRGLVLMLLGFASAMPLTHAYGDPQLATIIFVVSPAFLLVGLQSPDLFVMQRNMLVAQRGIYDLACGIGHMVFAIGLALLWRDVWALVWSLVIGTVFSTAMTYAFTPFRMPRLVWEKRFVSEIFHFGKWVFLSTAIYFASISTDKIYFSAVLPLAVVGIYGVARTFSDMLGSLAQRFGSFLVFPKVVELRQRDGDSGAGFRRKRRLALIAIAVAMAVSLAVSDRLILVLYDQRYHAAAFMLPILLAGVWFSVLAAFGEATLFGLDRPRASAYGNAAKFAILIVGLPLLVPTYGILAGLLTLLAAEFGRWVALSIALLRERLTSVGDDVAMTVATGVFAVGLKTVLGAIGLVPTLTGWWALGAAVHG